MEVHDYSQRSGAPMVVALALALCVASLVIGSPAAAVASVSPRVVGGSQTTIEAHPYQVAILDRNLGGNDFDQQFCGGALITPRIVLSAEHCFNQSGGPYVYPGDLQAVVGRTTLSGSGGQKLDITDAWVDDDYNGATTEWDSMLLVLSAAPSAPAAPIKVAGPDEAAMWDPNSPLEVSGWGVDSSGSASDSLRAATVPAVSDGDCADSMVWGSLFHPDSMLCAGYFAGGADACNGDSGGPLAARSTSGIYRLVGVVSWGADNPCGAVNGPGVYTRVAGTAYNPKLQNDVDFVESFDGLPDAGSIYGSGQQATANLPPQSIVRDSTSNPGDQKTGMRAAALKKCKKKRGRARHRCVKKAKRLPI